MPGWRPGNRYREPERQTPLRRRDDALMTRVVGLQLAILLAVLADLALRLAP